eukprot:TRINITY_DN781899_c0_g1_i1.p1 TRINITY_DN781899_c0_g1~~TRINITY_DN781899_c0_g1_i1.p1  ORF type:complete len:286 (+),score=66.24 TRINITY_DN781899_c0_g1_i1:56-913(+)
MNGLRGQSILNPDTLFNARNLFLLGHFQRVVNDLTGLTVNATEKLERDMLIHRSNIELGNPAQVVESITSDMIDLQIVRLLAQYDTDSSIDIDSSVELCNLTQPTQKIVAATLYLRQQKLEEALRILSDISNNLEAQSLRASIYLKMNRVDLARKELKEMEKVSIDGVLTQLTAAWCSCADGEHLASAVATFSQLENRYSSSSIIVNGQAACLMREHKFTLAEDCLAAYNARDPRDATTLVNLIICCQHIPGKDKVAESHLSNLKNFHPEHPWLLERIAIDSMFE